MTNCEFAECVNEAAAKGLCHSHYGQRRRGTPLRPLRTYNLVIDGKKACSACGEVKTADEFYPYTVGDKTRVSARCKECESEARREAVEAARKDRKMEVSRGRKPIGSPRRNRVQAMIDDETYARVRVAAARDGMTVSTWVEQMLRVAVGNP